MRTGDPRVLTCEDCGKQCKTVSALTRHRRCKQHHSVASARPRGLTHVCPHCGRQFLTLAALLTHRTVKHREKKVPCTSCDLSFPSHALRRAHERESEHGTEGGVGEDLEGDMEGIIDNLVRLSSPGFLDK
jgi:Zinc finger, C2H2 type